MGNLLGLASLLPSKQVSQTFGTLTVSIKDAPVQLSKLEVTIDSLEVQSKNYGWVNLPFVEGVESVHVDLLTLQDVSKELSTTQLPSGNYTNIRLHVKDATATYENGNVVPLKVPSDKIDVITRFEIKENTNTNLLIDMSADSVAISNSHNLKPVVKATVTSPVTPTPTPTATETPTQTSASTGTA